MNNVSPVEYGNTEQNSSVSGRKVANVCSAVSSLVCLHVCTLGEGRERSLVVREVTTEKGTSVPLLVTHGQTALVTKHLSSCVDMRQCPLNNESAIVTDKENNIYERPQWTSPGGLYMNEPFPIARQHCTSISDLLPSQYTLDPSHENHGLLLLGVPACSLAEVNVTGSAVGHFVPQPHFVMPQ